MPVNACSIKCLMEEVADMDNDFVTPVCVEGWTGNGPVDSHCGT